MGTFQPCTMVHDAVSRSNVGGDFLGNETILTVATVDHFQPRPLGEGLDGYTRSARRIGSEYL
jgi:hypothetical protein